MPITYFRDNKPIVSPAHSGGNPQFGDYMLITTPNGIHWYTQSTENRWIDLPYAEVPSEIKVLILLGVA